MTSTKQIEEYLSKKYDFQYNEVQNRTYYRKKGAGKPFTLIQDFEINSLLRELNNSHFNISRQRLKSLLESEFIVRVNPIKDYFDKLPRWDGTTDYITAYLKSVVTTDDNNFRWAFKKWFVAMIACAINPEVINHCAIILIGKQGIGKSTWFNNLLPKELKPYFYSGRINPSDKDTLLHLSECIIIVMEEIGAFSKAQTESFKELLTKDAIRVRRAYGVYAENYQRIASFVGSTNNREVLSDITGNRRFLVFEALKFHGTSQYDIDKVYAHGYALYHQGFQYWFDLSEIKRVNTINEKYRQISDEEQYLLKHFRKANNKKDNVISLNATEVVAGIQEAEGNGFTLDLSAIEMGKVLNALGFKLKNKKYQLVKKT